MATQDPPDTGNLLEPPINRAAIQSSHYRSLFYSSIASGEKQPFLIPQSLIPPFFITLIYLSIPHKDRPWLFRARWLVALLVVCLNYRVLITTSAANEAVGFAVGLIASWGTIWSLTFLIFTRPQWDAARVVREPKKLFESCSYSESDDDDVKPVDESNDPRAYDYAWQAYPSSGSFWARMGWACSLLLNFRLTGWNMANPAVVPCFPFPPSPKEGISAPPAQVELTIPVRTKAGYYRSLTYSSFLRSRLLHVTWSYLYLDLWTVLFRQDAYFIYGPSYRTSYASQGLLPYWLEVLPGPALAIVRSLAGITGIAAALFCYSYVYQLLCVFVLARSSGFLGAEGELWQYPTVFGGFAENVLERGLSGFWGGWWHQTFRKGFVAGVEWLWPDREEKGTDDGKEVLNGENGHAKKPGMNGHVMNGEGDKKGNKMNQNKKKKKKKEATKALVETTVAFLLSGTLHACGGITSAFRERTQFWGPLMFFGMQGVGCILQIWACSTLKPERWVSKRWLMVGNLLVVMGWLHLTGWGFIDDMSSAGVWMFEPIPVSVLRLLFGLRAAPGDENWWRWHGEYGFSWHTGKHWWQSGIRV